MMGKNAKVHRELGQEEVKGRLTEGDSRRMSR